MDDEQLNLWNFCKELNNTMFRTYYYTKEKYGDICENILKELYIEKFKEYKDFYSKNPIVFAEDYLGIRLKWYQRYLLRAQLPIVSNMMTNIRNKYILEMFKGVK